MSSIARVMLCLALAGMNSGLAGQSAPVSESTPALDTSSLDRSVDPCVDFYQYACGNWMAKNPIPSDQSRWGAFNQLAERNRIELRNILEQAAAKTAGRDAVSQKIGDFYASCMDEKAVEAAGLKPLQPELDRIAAILSKPDLIAEVAHMHLLGMDALFSFGSAPDLHNAALMVASVSQDGLGLPDRDYYLLPKYEETRKDYVAHVTRMFGLLGDDAETSATNAQQVMTIETALADASTSLVDLRSPENRDHKTSIDQLASSAPNLQFARFFAMTGAPRFDDLNVVTPVFFSQLNRLLETVPLADWKTYLRWHLVHQEADLLPAAFVNERFDFYGKTLAGAKEVQPRWKRCVSMTDNNLGEALGQPYVQLAFGPDAKVRMTRMVDAIEAALHRDIQQVPWMSDETRKQAEAKLEAIGNKIGYPDRWRDYSTLKIVRGDLIGNDQRASAFEARRDLNKIGKALDKTEWDMTPPTVNAYYSPEQNNVNFPAGILQPPFFNRNADDPVNYGAIGMVIGHELTHGFDDQGSKYDAQGNLRNWWTEKDNQEFRKKTQCVADEYSGFVSVKDPSGDRSRDTHLNGDLTLGENTADSGGLHLAFMALMNGLQGVEEKTIDGFTPQQRFFLGFAQVWCENQTPQSLKQRAVTDPHSPGRFRVNGTVVNNSDFEKAFSCKPGQPMVSANACTVW